jgi:mannose-1-phosphate guanylyltransferase
MFIFNVSTIFDEIERYMPRHHDILKLIKVDVDMGLIGEELANAVAIPFENFQKMSIDFGVMERSDKIRVIPTNFGWNDIGAFTALEEVFEPNENGTIVRMTDISEYDSKNNLVIGIDKHIALVGVKDLVIVQTDKHLLVCSKDHVQDIKRILN